MGVDRPTLGGKNGVQGFCQARVVLVGYDFRWTWAREDLDRGAAVDSESDRGVTVNDSMFAAQNQLSAPFSDPVAPRRRHGNLARMLSNKLAARS